jgi:NTE family protein
VNSQAIDVIMTGGGVRLAAYVGALAAFRDMGVEVRSVAGASAGSIVASFLSTGWSTNEMLRCLIETDFTFFKDLSLRALLFQSSLYSGRRFERWMDRQLDGVRFRAVGQDLYIAALDLATHRPFLFSRVTTPDVPVSAAVRCSMSIPGIWSARRWEEKVLIDGTFTSWIPIALQMLHDGSQGNGSRRAVILRIVSDDIDEPRVKSHLWPWDLVRIVLDSILVSLENTRVPGSLWQDTILIRDHGIRPLQFDLRPSDKERLFEVGYDQARRYFHKKSAVPS